MVHSSAQGTRSASISKGPRAKQAIVISIRVSMVICMPVPCRNRHFNLCRKEHTVNSHVEDEIVALHRFFEDWFNARLPQTEDAFKSMDQVMGEEFIIVMPDGRSVGRNPLLELLYKAHGKRVGIKIWIEDVRPIIQEGGLTVAEYQEWQTEDGETTSRVSTAVFRDAPETPNGQSWLRVHETWINRD